MKNPILVLGAGRSAYSLLVYLNDLAEKENFRFTLAEAQSEILLAKLKDLPNADGHTFSSSEVSDFIEIILGHKIVISLLPPTMHPIVGKACLECNANLITASYESPQMREMAEDIEAKGLIFINECGLDPGIDHLSAMEIIDEIKEKGGIISKFHSYCGGLVADEDDDNPFRYKISWNPKNVVLAGKGTAKFLQNNRHTLLPYNRVFSSAETVFIKEWGKFEAYPNRDSVSYANIYGIPDVAYLKRGTLRKTGFCKRWNVFVQLGMTDDETKIEFAPGATYMDYMAVFLPEFLEGGSRALENFIGNVLISNDIIELGFNPEKPDILKRNNGTPADFLLDLIVEKWSLKTNDKDLVVMVHQFEYSLNGFGYQLIASFGLEGKNAINTAMAQTVGLPLGICAKLLLHNQIGQKGLVLPIIKDLYKPILKELSNFGVHFQKELSVLNKSII